MLTFRGLSRLFNNLSKVGSDDANDSPLPLRVSSFPFVSGDTFRLMAGTEFLHDEIREHIGLPRELAFCDTDVASQPQFPDRYERWAQESKINKPVLLIHNGDVLPTELALKQLSNTSSAVFCVNLVREFARVHALPIGLENASRNYNGRLGFYLEGFDPNPRHRVKRVLSSFHEETNEAVRKPVRMLMEESRFGYDGFKWKLGEYRQALRKTKFVIAPPGNGNDTHRAWEAIYLGAVPVVLKGYLAASLVRALPLLEVESYEDFVTKGDDELDHLYKVIRQKDPKVAYFPYWSARVLESLSPL